MLGYKVPSSLIEKIERETYHIGDFSYLNGMDKVLDSIKELGEVELDNPWHTGKPTEGGLFLVYLKDGTYDIYEFGKEYEAWHIGFKGVVKWQKIEED